MDFFPWLRNSYGVEPDDVITARAREAIKTSTVISKIFPNDPPRVQRLGQGKIGLCYAVLNSLQSANINPETTESDYVKGAEHLAKWYIDLYPPVREDSPRREEEKMSSEEDSSEETEEDTKKKQEHSKTEDDEKESSKGAKSGAKNGKKKSSRSQRKGKDRKGSKKKEKKTDTPKDNNSGDSSSSEEDSSAEDDGSSDEGNSKPNSKPNSKSYNKLPHYLDPDYLYSLEPIRVFVDNFGNWAQDYVDELSAREAFAQVLNDGHHTELFQDKTGRHPYVNLVRKVWAGALDCALDKAEELLGDGEYQEALDLANKRDFLNKFKLIDLTGYSLKEASMAAMSNRLEDHLVLEKVVQLIKEKEKKNKVVEMLETVLKNRAHPEIAIRAGGVRGLIAAQLENDPEKAQRLLRLSLEKARKLGAHRRAWAKEMRKWLNDLLRGDGREEEEEREDADSQEVKEKIRDIEEQSEGLGLIRFAMYILNKFPPLHYPSFNLSDLVNMLMNPATSFKKAALKLILHYHPDKVDEEKHGQGYKAVCVAITRVFNEKK